jgi:hypothetical protein
MAKPTPPKDDLSSLLDKFQVNLSADTRDESTKLEDAWVARFEEIRKTVIRPTMEALGAQIQARGHDFNIVETQFKRGLRPTPDEAGIRMDLYLATERTRTNIGMDRRPFIGFSTHHRSELVHLTICDITSKGGVVSKVGDYMLERVDATLIKEKFVALFKRLASQ